jgi:hypothetical protein
MRLTSDDSTFELQVVGYQFPHLEREPYDADWLNIRIDVSLPQGSWTSLDPSLLTWELASLHQWLTSIADGTSVESEESFMEPNLRFELSGEGSRNLRVYFELESRPSWAPSDGAGMDDLWAEFRIDPTELKTAAASLREYIVKFPVRVGH